MLIPAYKDMDPYDLPEEFSHLQAQDMTKLGFMQDLIRGIKKILGADQPKAAVKETVVVQQGAANNNVQALLDRGNMALEDGEWEKADGFFEEVLNQDAKSAEAYLGKLLAKCKRSNVPALTQYYILKYESSKYEYALNAKASELESSAKMLADLEDEEGRLVSEISNIDSQIMRLNNEYSSLGIFAGKRKKEITQEIDKLRLLKEKKEDEKRINEGKMQGCTSEKISSMIAQNEIEIKYAENEIGQLNKEVNDLVEEMDKESNEISYDEALALLEKSTVKDAFYKKYMGLYIKTNRIGVGGYITFGNKKTEWLVLDIEYSLDMEYSKVLVISKYAIETRPYNTEGTSTTWEKCTLRSWLNGEYVEIQVSQETSAIIVARRSQKLLRN